MNKHTTQRDGNEIAAEYDEKICLNLVRFGYLTARMIAFIIRGCDDAEDMRAAQRRLRSLAARQLVIQERLDNGIPVYKLTQKGARFLTDLGYQGIPKRGTRDARTGNCFHRSLTNQYLIIWREDFDRFWPEYSVLKGWAPFKNFSHKGYRMVPDALALMKEDHSTGTKSGLLWIEAENAVKSPKRLKQIADLANYILDPESSYCRCKGNSTHRVTRFLFICPNLARARAVARAFSEFSSRSEIVDHAEILIAPMKNSLVWPQAEDCWYGTLSDFVAREGIVESPDSPIHTDDQGECDDSDHNQDDRDFDEILEEMYGTEYENEYSEDFGEESPEALGAFEDMVLTHHQEIKVSPTNETTWRDYEHKLRDHFDDDIEPVEEYPIIWFDPPE